MTFMVVMRRGPTYHGVEAIRFTDGEHRVVFKGHTREPRIISMFEVLEIYDISETVIDKKSAKQKKLGGP